MPSSPIFKAAVVRNLCTSPFGIPWGSSCEPAVPESSTRLALLQPVRRCLFDGARARNKDVHEPPGALLPARSGRYMRYADQRSKQVEGFEIFSHVAAFDRASDQRINRSVDQSARALKQLRGASDDTIQCGGNDLLCSDVVDEEQHPRS